MFVKFVTCCLDANLAYLQCVMSSNESYLYGINFVIKFLLNNKTTSQTLIITNSFTFTF